MKFSRLSRLGNMGLFYVYFLFGLTALAENSFFDDHARGWFWYEDPKQAEELLEKKPEASPNSLTLALQAKPKTAVERLKEVQETLAELKANAILEPTRENVKAYQEMQLKVMNQSQAFSDTWLLNVFMNPALDETVKNPSAQSARFVVYENEREETEKIIQGLKQTYGLFYFYSGSCSYCQAFTPIVKQFADKYGWEVMAVSLDGTASETFKNWQPDNGIARQWNVQTVPAVFAINPETNHVIPVAHGFTAIDAMEKRIVMITNHDVLANANGRDR